MNLDPVFESDGVWFVEYTPYDGEGPLCFEFPTRAQALTELSSLRSGNAPSRMSLRINGHAVTREDILMLGPDATTQKYNALPAKSTSVSRELMQREVLKWSGGKTSKVG